MGLTVANKDRAVGVHINTMRASESALERIALTTTALLATACDELEIARFGLD